METEMQGRTRSCKAYRALRLTGLALLLAGPALAEGECLQADAFYADLHSNAVVAFSQAFVEAPGVANSFDMLIGETALQGIVMWSGGVQRPQAVLLDECPDGATADQLDTCTLWQGTVYSVGSNGDVGFLPGANDIAAERLLFPGLPWQLSYSETFTATEPENLPFEVFQRTGCAE